MQPSFDSEMTFERVEPVKLKNVITSMEHDIAKDPENRATEALPVGASSNDSESLVSSEDAFKRSLSSLPTQTCSCAS